jgi:TP901 family phage tail tape measure protein
MMIFDIIARDGASGTFTKVGTSAEAASKKIDLLGKAAFGMTALFAAFAVKDAVKFESAMTRISTQASVPVKNIKALSDAVLQLSPKVGFDPTELATSLYHVESAFHSTGISAKDAIGVVAAASKLSKIGNADLETTTQAVVGVLASKIKGVRDAADAAAQLNLLVGSGDTTLQKVAASIATGILPTAQSLGLSFKDVAAALATLTDNVTPADEAATRLRTTLSLVENPSPKAIGALKSIGLSSVQLAEDFRKPDGLLVALKDLKTHLDNTYDLKSSKPLSLDQITTAGKAFRDEVTAQGASTVEADKLTKKYVDGLKQGGSAATLQARVILSAFGGARSGATFLTLFNELDRLQSKYKDFGTSQQAAAKFAQAWAQQQGTAKQKLDDLKASWKVFLVQVGNAILPDLKAVVDVLAKHPGILKAAAVAVGVFGAAWAGLKIAGFIKGVATLTARILGLGRASTVAAAEMNASTGIAGAAEKSFLGVTGIGTAVSRLAGGAALAVVGKMLFDWAQSAGNARRQIDAVVNAKITNPYDPSQLNAAAAGIDGLVQKASKHNSSLGSLITGAFSGSDFTNSALIDQGEKKYAALRATAVNLGIAISELHNRFGLTNDDLTSLAAKSNIKFGTDVKGLVQGEDAFKKIYAAELDALPVNQKFASGLKDTAGAASDTGNKIDALSGIVGGLISKQAGSLQATDGYHKALNDLGSSLDSNSKTLLGNADAAINNRAAMVNLVEQSAAAATAYAKGTGKADDYTKALQFAIPEIEAAAAAQGVSKQEIDGIITGLGLMPDSKTVPFSSPGLTESLTALAEYNRQLALVPQSIITQVTQMYGSAGPTSVNDPRISGHKAAGGFVTGPGSGTSDSILTWLSNGEYVMPAHVVKQMGVGFFDQLRGVKTPGFAAGGLVGANSPETSYLQSLNVAAYLKTIAAATVAMTAKLTTFVQNQQQYRDSLKSTVTSGSTISDLLAQSGNAGDLKRLFAGKIGDIRAFAGKITALKKQGWPDAIIREIAGDGINIGSNYADLLLSASKSDRSSLIGSAGTLGGAQLGTANLITLMTGGTAGLTKMPAIAALNKAIFNPGASQGTLIGKAAAAQTSPLIHIDHVSSTVDLQLIAKQAAFLQSAGHFG